MASPAVDAILGLDRFQALWQRCLLGDEPDRSAQIHQRLLDAYSEPHRFYHTLAHIEHCLTLFDECRTHIGNPDAVELAIWFHDAIYESGARDNEARSAVLYAEVADGVHDPELTGLVGRMIIATIHDGNSLEDDDTRYMVDIDLSSFGLSWDEFLVDSRNLRDENPQTSDEDYNRNQGNFQNRLLARDRFFLSDFFYRRYEAQARKNLARYFDYIRDPD